MKENLELKSALSVLESQNEHLKTKERNLKQKSAEAKQNFTQCQESMGKYLHLIKNWDWWTYCICTQLIWRMWTAIANPRSGSWMFARPSWPSCPRWWRRSWQWSQTPGRPPPMLSRGPRIWKETSNKQKQKLTDFLPVWVGVVLININCHW